MAIMLPSLRDERRQTYSPFLPIHPRTGRVMQVPIDEVRRRGRHDRLARSRYRRAVRDAGDRRARQAAMEARLGDALAGARRRLRDGRQGPHRQRPAVGRDLRALGGLPPEGFNYELFLDENGQKISKSRGNGLTIEEWLAYATPESLSLFMYAKPREAKRLSFEVIPRTVDDYLALLEKYPSQDLKVRLGNPVWHIHDGAPPAPELLRSGAEGRPGTTLSFAMLLNLVAVANSEEPGVLWGFIRRYAPGVSPQSIRASTASCVYAVRYFRDFVRPAKRYHAPTGEERAALLDLAEALAPLEGSTDAEAIQAVVYEVGRRHVPDSPQVEGPDGRPGVAQAWFSTSTDPARRRGAGRASARSSRSTASPRRAR